MNIHNVKTILAKTGSRSGGLLDTKLKPLAEIAAVQKCPIDKLNMTDSFPDLMTWTGGRTKLPYLLLETIISLLPCDWAQVLRCWQQELQGWALSCRFLPVPTNPLQDTSEPYSQDDAFLGKTLKKWQKMQGGGRWREQKRVRNSRGNTKVREENVPTTGAEIRLQPIEDPTGGYFLKKFSSRGDRSRKEVWG